MSTAKHHLAYKNRQIAKYLAEHQKMPRCACGCGEAVGFNCNGKPNTYLSGHQPTDGLELGRQRFGKDLIPLADFRQAMRSLKEARGWTWGQLAEAGGISESHIKSLMYDTTKKNVGLEWATDFMKRLAGLPASVSVHQKNLAQKIKRAEREIERTIEGHSVG